MQDEKQAKVEVENDAEAKELAPKLIESMKAIVQEFAQVLAQQQEFQNKLVSEMSKKKTITAKSSTGTTLQATIQ
jgi:hypothetical protein